MRILSYNLKYASETDPHPWSQRRSAMIELITSHTPHVLGTQEGLADQLHDLADGLGPDFRWVGESRHGAGGEFGAVFYDTRRLHLTAVEHRWLSDTPDVPGSRSWGNELPRMVTDVRFTDQLTGTALRVLNTHVDHLSTAAQLRSADFLRDLIRARPDPTVLLGDFNTAAETSEPYWRLLGTPLKDAFLAADQRGPRLGSFGDWGPPEPDGVRIDWILISPRLPVHRAEIVDRTVDGHYPSDHLPVMAEIDLDSPTGSEV